MLMKMTGKVYDSHWITVSGFCSHFEYESHVFKLFKQFGEIIECQKPADTNFVNIRFENIEQARESLIWDGTFLNRNVIIGVKPSAAINFQQWEKHDKSPPPSEQESLAKTKLENHHIIMEKYLENEELSTLPTNILKEEEPEQVIQANVDGNNDAAVDDDSISQEQTKCSENGSSSGEKTQVQLDHDINHDVVPQAGNVTKKSEEFSNSIPVKTECEQENVSAVSIQKLVGACEHFENNSGIRQRYFCIPCGKHFDSESKLKMHEAAHPIHEVNDHRFLCDYYGQYFPRLSSLKVHIQGKHKGVKAFKCHLCEKSYFTDSGLQEHLQKHELSGKRPIACDECSKTYANRSSLYRHKKLHAGTCHVCDICGRAFGDVTQLNVHRERRHTRTYECEKCGLIFSSFNALRIHKPTHRYFIHKCKKCGMNFRENYECNRHEEDCGEKP